MPSSSVASLALKKYRIRDLILLSIGCIFLLAVCLLTVANAVSWRSHAHSGWFNPFDVGIETHLNRFANRWPLFDHGMALLTDHNLIKGAPIVFLYWMAFFPMSFTQSERLQKRRKLTAAIPLCLFALAFTRILSLVLPFRDRPIQSIHLDFLPQGWTISSFPSDHAALFMALAVGVWFGSRRLGVAAIAYTVLFIMFPRMYLGVHWPTDLLAGALIGAAISMSAGFPRYQDFVWSWAAKWWRRSPGTLAASAFLLSYEIVDLFSSPIKIVSELIKHWHR